MAVLVAANHLEVEAESTLRNSSMNRNERRIAARKSRTVPNGAGGDTPAALHATGFGHFQAGRQLEAQICCQRSLALDAGHADTLQLMGLLSLQAKQYDAAIEWVGRADRADPGMNYLLNLGTALEQQGLQEEALKTFDKAVQIRPDDAELWTRLANVFVVLKRPDPAILSYEHALKLNPRYWYAVYNYAVLLLQSMRFEEALINLNLCDELQPNHAATLNHRGKALHDLSRYEEALSDSRQAQTLDPASAEICTVIGKCLQKLGRHAEAIESFDRALDLQPNFVTALNDKAFTLGEIQRFDEALLLYRFVKSIDPENALADFNVGLIQLLNGDLEAGWRGQDARWKLSFLSGTANYPKLPQPLWRGEENIEGKTILLCADEGQGDAIQFVRYVPMLTALGARVIVLADDEACPLLSTLSGVAQVFPKSVNILPAFDIHCPMSSLPLAFRTTLETIPVATSYLSTPAGDRRQVWEDRLGSHDRLRVGLVWSGNPKHRNDHNRSISLRTLSSVLDADASFVSLQKDPRSLDKETLIERTDIVDLTAHLTDFMETAALIGCLDLVITVDTSVAHLAGALGCPTWILLPHTPDWRWLLDRDDSPWYPTVRLFRQTETRDYAGVLDRVRTELRTLVTANSHSSRLQ
jgi:tetratricopeptide (TPR) repeat protein